MSLCETLKDFAYSFLNFQATITTELSYNGVVGLVLFVLIFELYWLNWGKEKLAKRINHINMKAYLVALFTYVLNKGKLRFVLNDFK